MELHGWSTMELTSSDQVVGSSPAIDWDLLVGFRLEFPPHAWPPLLLHRLVDVVLRQSAQGGKH